MCSCAPCPARRPPPPPAMRRRASCTCSTATAAPARASPCRWETSRCAERAIQVPARAMCPGCNMQRAAPGTTAVDAPVRAWRRTCAQTPRVPRCAPAAPRACLSPPWPPQAQVAVADVDNDGRLELVAGDARGNLAAFTADGKEVWETHLESQIHQVGACRACPCRYFLLPSVLPGAQPCSCALLGGLAHAGGRAGAVPAEATCGGAGGRCAPARPPRPRLHLTVGAPLRPAPQNPVFGDVDGDGQLEVVVATFRHVGGPLGL